MPFDPKVLQGEKSASQRDKKPTFLQWLKSAKQKELATAHTVTTIWTPGTWDNFTMETELFRIRVPKGDPMYQALDDFTSDKNTVHMELKVQAVAKESKAYVVDVVTGSSGAWTELGENGYRWQP